MPTFLWIVLGIAAWTVCGVLVVAVCCAARRGDSLSPDAQMGMDPNVELPARPRLVLDVTPVSRPWAAAGAGAPGAPALEPVRRS